MTDVILTNPAGMAGAIVERSLRDYGLNIVLMEEPNARKMEVSYIARLHKFVDIYSPDSIWPVFFCDILAKHREEFPGINIPLSSERTILTLDNKRSACALASELGIRQPGSVSSPADDRAVVFKRLMGLGGDSVYFPRTEKALGNLISSCNDGEYLLTEYIEGDDVSVDAIRWGGYFHGEAYKVLEPRRKGVSLRRVSIEAPDLVDSVRRILDAVGYEGVCGADFRVRDDGEAYFLECNPRFSGGLESAVASGFDIPRILWQLSHGIVPDPVRFTPGVITGTQVQCNSPE